MWPPSRLRHQVNVRSTIATIRCNHAAIGKRPARSTMSRMVDHRTSRSSTLRPSPTEMKMNVVSPARAELKNPPPSARNTEKHAVLTQIIRRIVLRTRTVSLTQLLPFCHCRFMQQKTSRRSRSSIYVEALTETNAQDQLGKRVQASARRRFQTVRAEHSIMSLRNGYLLR